MKSIEIVIAPSAIGGLLYTLVQLLYLPNIAISTLGYLTGAGFTFGAHTNIEPTHFVLNGISAIPVLSALPTGKHPLVAYGIALWPIALLLVMIVIRRNLREFKRRLVESLATLIIFIAGVALVGYLASGELLTQALNRVGVQWIRLTVVVAVSAFAALVVGILLPRWMNWLGVRFASRNRAYVEADGDE